MNRRKFVTFVAISGAIAYSTQFLTNLPLIGTQVAQADTEKNETLKNLQAAYNGESNAHHRYLAFAKKADQEGYKQVAVVF